MKTKIILITALFVGLFTVGCETSAKLNDVRIGMTRDQVVSILGQPDSTSAQANVQYMTYYLDTTSDYRDRAYMVRLVNGKVESFGRFAQLVDLYNRPVTNATPGQPDFPQLGIGTAGTPVVNLPAPTPKLDLASQIERLKALKDQGVLTDEEFQKAKAKLLAQP